MCNPLVRATRLGLCLLAGSLAPGFGRAAGSTPDPRPRLLVLTDIGGDPDDRQSMIRLMTYANEFVIEGLVASASGTPGELKEAVVRPDLIREIVDAYATVQPNLVRHDPRYPPAAGLRAVVKAGNPQRGRAHIGAGHDTEGSQWIIARADQADPRPLNIAVWGGQTDLAQALWRVRSDRGEAGFARFATRLRVHDIADQDGIQSWMAQEFPGLFYVLDKAPPGRERREAVFRGMYLDGDLDLTSRAWIDAHVREGHGALGALYPTRTWTAPNPHGVLKEGDTPSWFFFLPNGVNDPAHPDWGGWGGRFERVDNGVFRDAPDRLGEEAHPRVGVWRWRPAFQADFQARMDWCVRAPDAANHAPRISVKSPEGGLAVVDDGPDRGAYGILRLVTEAGRRVRLDASDSQDPDGDVLRFRWWIHEAPGRESRAATLESAGTASASLALPVNPPRSEVHVVVEATDDGEPALTSFQRLVVEVKGGG